MSTNAESNRAPGGRVGQYQVLSRLAVGGMAEIFLAVAKNSDGTPALVTLKRILPDLRAEPEFARMFINEARICVALAHRNIAQVYELGQDAGELFISMEFVAGQSLTNILRVFRSLGRPVPMGFAAMVVRDVCRALQAAHELKSPTGELTPVIHRDVSPNNIMVTYTGEVRVIDFGVAKAKGSLSRTGNDVVKGSIGYMSPEQARGQPLDARSDVFSAGAVLHELLTGKPLFLRDSELLTFRGILRDEIPPPTQKNPGVPAALSAAVMTALARPLNARFPSAADFGRAIEQAVPALFFDAQKASDLMCDVFDEPNERTRLLVEALHEGADLPELFAAADRLASATAKPPMSPQNMGGNVLSGTDVYGTMSTGVMRLKDGKAVPAGRAAPAPVSAAPVKLAVEAPPPPPMATGVMRLEHGRPVPVGRAAPPAAAEAPLQLSHAVPAPLLLSTPLLAAPPTPVPPVVPATVEGAVVLSVDDSEISRAFIEAHLESYGFPVLGSATAEQALKLLDERVPDLVLLDVNMPDVDGYELCRRIRAKCTQRPFLPILFLSSELNFEERLKGLAAGGDDFLGKPYQPEELVAVVRAHLRRAAFLEHLARERAARTRAAPAPWGPGA